MDDEGHNIPSYLVNASFRQLDWYMDAHGQRVQCGIQQSEQQVITPDEIV